MNKEELLMQHPNAEFSENGNVYIKPLTTRVYQAYPIRDSDGQLMRGVIEISLNDLDRILNKTLMFTADLSGTEPFVQSPEEAAVEEENVRQVRAAEIRVRMAELDFDINACMDGAIKAKSEAEYRAERVELRNELRQIEGKAALQMKEEQA